MIQDLPGLNSEQMNQQVYKDLVYRVFENKEPKSVNLRTMDEFDQIFFGYLFVFEIGNSKSLEDALNYHEEICKREVIKQPNGSSLITKKLLVGTMQDKQV